MVEFCVEGPIARSDLPGIVARLGALLEHADAAIVECRLSGVHASAESLEALAHLRLVVCRHGCLMTVSGASAELRELVEFAGMQDLLRI
jgi:ABC-type transporter Mla MlaB component